MVNELSTAEALALCDELAELGTTKVHLSGGEPLLRPDWPVLTDRLKTKGVRVHLITNGLLFSTAVARQCVDLGIDMVAVSIDGLMDVNDGIRRYPKGRGGVSPFRRAYEAVVLSKAVGIRTMVITHLNGWNLSQLDAMHDLFALLPLDGWQLQLGMVEGRMKTAPAGYALKPLHLLQIGDFISRKQNNPFRIITADNIGYFTEAETRLRPYDDKHFPFFTGCMAGIRAVAVGPDGTVKGCPSMGAGLTEGNIRKHSLKEIWSDPNAFAYNRKWDGRKLTGFCRTCEFRHLCRGGCTSFAASQGSLYENDFCLYRLSRQSAEAGEPR